MHNVDLDDLNATIEKARQDPSAVVMSTSFDGAWNTAGGPQFTATIPLPDGGQVEFAADFPPPMGGTGSAPNPLAYCFWGGLACYAMTFAQEAAKAGVELRALRARVEAEVDQSRALGVTDNPPVERIDWTLHVEADAAAGRLDAIKRSADDHCPGVYCLRNPIELRTTLEA
jgi:uncharacterized OsmC-like protein